MPFLLPAAASAVAAAAPAAAAAGASAAASAGIGATLTSIAGNVLMNVAISAAMSIFQPQVGVAGRTFEWTLDPDGPIPFAAGRIGVPGSAVYRKTFGPDLMYYGIPSVISGAGPIAAFEGFMADDETVTFDGSGKAVSSQYAGELWYKNKLGTQPDTAITSPTGLKNGATLPGWTSAHRLSGKASYMIVMGENSKGTAFPTGEVKPLITLRGLLVYDPRKDSTYPGGSGEHRLSNPLTWEYSANPILWALKWTLGLWEGPNGKGAPQVDYQVGGIGAKLSGIDVPAFVAAANVADANGWTCAAYPTTDDDKHQVLTGFLQAGGAIYAQRAGKISCIQRAAPRTSIVTISAYDTAGPLEIDTAASRIDRINTLRPRFWSEPHRWQMTALDQEVTAQAYRDEDGGVRPAGIDYPYVTDAVQASQLAALQIANTREGIAGVIPLKPHLQRIRPGDAFTITEAGFVLNGLKCLCLNTDYDPATGVVRVSFVSETDAKYPFALGQDPTPPTPQVLTPTDPTFVTPPLPGDWVITPRPPSGDGTQQPGFDLTGLVSNATATAVIVEWGPTADGPWTQAYAGPPDVTSIPIVGLQSGATYFIAVRYQRNSNFSDRYVYGPFVAPTLTAGVSEETVEQIVSEVTGQIEGIATGRDAAEHLAEVVLETILDEQQKLESEASQRVEDLLNEAGARNTAVAAAIQQSKAYTDDFASSASQTFATITALNGGLAATLNEAKSFTTGQLSSAMLTVYTKAQTDAGLATTLQSARSYTDTYKSEAQLLFSTKAERASGDANAVIEAKAYTDDYKTQASLTFATQVAMGQANAATLSSAQSYSDGKLATALNTVYTKAQTDSALSTTLQQARSYSDDKAAEASLLYSTKTERANGDASTLQSAKSYTDDYKSTAALTFATQSSLNGVSATAALALSTSQDAASKLNEARIRIVADAQGGQPAVVEIVSTTGAGSYIRLGAQQIGFGDNTVFDDATDTLQTVINGRRRVLALGAPFGQGGNLIEWWGPSNISLGSMTTGNGDNGRMTASPYVFDNTLASAFTASTNTGFIGGARNGAGPVQTSNSVTVTVSGGTAGATIRWVRLSGDSRINMNDPTAFTTGAYATIGVGEVISAYFMGAVTKSGKSAVVYVQVDLSDNGT